MPAGYSGKPLILKLGIRPDARVFFDGAPAEVLDEIGPLPSGAVVRKQARGELDYAHVFVTRRKDLEARFPKVAARMAEGGMVWVSWPKKASRVKTDVTEDVLREVILPTGWVDVKVAAVDETWSGLKFLRRRK